MVKKKVQVEEPASVIANIDVKLEDVEGIGPVRLKKLFANNIYTVDDLIPHGEEALVRMLEINWGEATKLIQMATEAMNDDAVTANMFVSGEDFYNYRKNTIEYMTTGHEEFDEVTGGYESSVITEFFGLFGSGKTQFMMVAGIMAQMPKDRCCLDCGKVYTLPIKPNDNEEEFKKKLEEWKLEFEKQNISACECGGKVWNGGGMSDFKKPCRVIYIDTENSYRPERVFQIVCNRGLVKTKEQTKTQIKQEADKEPLNEEEWNKAMEFVRNIDVAHPRTSARQMLTVSSLAAAIEGDFCKVCGKREVNKDNLPTHQDHPLAKSTMELLSHDFTRKKKARLVIVDSITGKFRKEFEGRGTLSDRQTKLSTHIKILEGTVENKNVVCLVTNQAQEVMGLAGTHADNVRPVGGNVIGHTFTNRIYLKKGQSITKDVITAILVDSPNRAKNEVKMQLGPNGIQDLET